MIDLTGKRLLVMGGVPLASDIIKAAHEMGVYVVVTDYLADSPAKKFADESSMVSTTDVDAVVKLCKEKKIDGVFTGYIDSILPYCYEVCKRLGMPFYQTQDEIEHSINKRKFKDLCLRCGVPVATDYRVDSANIPFPVAVKPADNSGSRGFSIAHDQRELKKAYESALLFSPSKNVIIEDFLTGKEITLYYTVQDGYVSLSTISERFHLKNYTQVPAATLFLPEYMNLYTKDMHDSVCKFAHSLGMQNGSFILQAYYTKDGFKCMEIIHRLSGIRQYVVITHENEIDIVKMHINHALTGKFDGWDVKAYDNPDFKHVYAYITFVFDHCGIIGKINGLSVLAQKKGVINTHISYTVGNRITEPMFGTLQQIFARCYIVADNKKELAELINSIADILEVLDSDGNNMVVMPFDTKEFYNG